MEEHIYDLVSTITGWSDGDIARIVGLARSTVQAQRCGRIPTNLRQEQTAALINAVRMYRDQVVAGTAELELFA